VAAEEQLRTDVDLKVPTKMGREQLTREILNDAQKVIVPLGIELIDVRIKRLKASGRTRRSC